MPNTNFQTIHQMGSAISNVVKQASGRDPVQNIDMDFVTVAQNKTIGEMTISGNPASFHTGNSVPIQRLLIGMEPKQSGSGDPSPSNVRPITGWTGLNVSRTGINLLPRATVDDDNGLTITVNSDNSISISGTATGTGGYITNRIILPCTIKKDTVITIGTTTNIPTSRLRIFPDQGSFDIVNGTNYKTVTASIDITTIRFYLFTTANEAYNFTIYPQIELGSSASPYEEYVGTTIPVTFPDPPGTVYKGTLDLISGQLTVTHLMQTFTGAESEDWLDSYAINGFRINSRGMKVALLNTGLCNWLPVLSEVGNAIGVALGMNDSDIYVRHITDTLEIADLTEWRAYLAQHPLEVFYPLEPAQYYQVTPQDLNTLVGDNVVFTDGDTLEVMYYQYGEV